MSKHRFGLLEVEMIRRGVALRHARRAALELECHHRELVEQALGRGESSEQAERSAHEALGTDALIVERYASQKELQSWAYRWHVIYVLAPLVGFAAASVVVMLSLLAVTNTFRPELRHTRLPAALTHGVDFAVSAFFLWVIPVAVAIGFGVLANRQRIAFRWQLAGIVLLCVVAALVNVEFVVTGGPLAGHANAGIGFSTAHLLRELLRTLAMAALTLIPAVWLRSRAMSRWATLQ